MKDLLDKLIAIICAPYKFLQSFSSKYKKSNTRQETHHQTITAPKSVSSNTTAQTAQPVKKIEADVVFPKIDDGYFLRWEKKENIALPQNLDKVKLNDCDIELVPEPENQYDPNVVALYKSGHKLGYFFKGQTQEMILSYLDHKNYQIKTVVCLLDQENNKLAVRIAFYRNLDSVQLDTFTAPLVKITKRAEDWGTSRYDNVSSIYVGDLCEITENSDGGYTVCDEYGNELGELNSNTAEKIEAFFGDIVYAKIANIEETESGAYKVKISIFYR